jgi:serine/threonine protein kinase
MSKVTKAIEWSDLELVNILGEGQAGKVWLAKLKRQFKDFPVGAYVAVKSYKSWVLEQPGQFERIIRELELGRRINHPNLVKTLSIIRDNEGKPSLIMNYCAGETLESYLEERSRRNEYVKNDFAFKIIGDLASVINAIHQAGAIHRDVKPANIIISDHGPILMDLGVIRSNDFPEQTTSGSFLGTIRYAAPEYLFGENYDSSIDVYSLGAIASEIFVGKRFPTEETQWARLIRVKDYGIRLNYQALQQRYGLNATEFIRFILEKMLAQRKERLDLKELLEAFNVRLWDKAFYILDGKLVGGEPEIRYLGEREKASKDTFRQVVEDLRKKINEEDRDFLRQLLDQKYYPHVEHPYRQYWSFMFDNRIERLRKVGCFVNERKADKRDETRFDLHEAVIAAYRYGYL